MVLIALLTLCQTADELVERLRSDTVEVRESAVQLLVKMGEEARIALEKAAKDGDDEVAARARELLKPLDARKAFQQIEEAVAKAKTVRVRLKGVTSSQFGGLDMTVLVEECVLLLAEGNKALATFHRINSMEGTQIDGLLLSDGSRMMWKSGADEEKALTPDTLKQSLGSVIVGWGGRGIIQPTLKKGFLAEDRFPKDQPMIFDSVRQDGDSRTIAYRIIQKPREIAVELTYTPKSLTPVRRVATWSTNDRKVTLTETYEEFALDVAMPEDAFRLEARFSTVQAGLTKVIGFKGIADLTPLETQDDGYKIFVQYLTETERETLEKEALTVPYAEFSTRSSKLRGQPVRLTALFLGSFPVTLQEKIGKQETASRVYLCDPTGKEGYVIDLLEPFADVKKRDWVSVEGAFLKIATYEGQKGPMQAPFFIGRTLRAVEAPK